jgi:hypothetical protein
MRFHAGGPLSYRRPFIYLALLTLSWREAVACPLCDSGTAEAVRAGVLSTLTDPSVLLAAALPFAAIAGVVSLLNLDCIERWL